MWSVDYTTIGVMCTIQSLLLQYKIHTRVCRVVNWEDSHVVSQAESILQSDKQPDKHLKSFSWWIGCSWLVCYDVVSSEREVCCRRFYRCLFTAAREFAVSDVVFVVDDDVRLILESSHLYM